LATGSRTRVGASRSAARDTKSTLRLRAAWLQRLRPFRPRSDATGAASQNRWPRWCSFDFVPDLRDRNDDPPRVVGHMSLRDGNGRDKRQVQALSPRSFNDASAAQPPLLPLRCGRRRGAAHAKHLPQEALARRIGRARPRSLQSGSSAPSSSQRRELLLLLSRSHFSAGMVDDRGGMICGRSGLHPQPAGFQPALQLGALHVRIDHALLGSGFQLVVGEPGQRVCDRVMRREQSSGGELLQPRIFSHLDELAEGRLLERQPFDKLLLLAPREELAFLAAPPSDLHHAVRGMAPAVDNAVSVAAGRRCVRDGRGLVFPRGKIGLNLTHFVVPLIVRWPGSVACLACSHRRGAIRAASNSYLGAVDLEGRARNPETRMGTPIPPDRPKPGRARMDTKATPPLQAASRLPARDRSTLKTAMLFPAPRRNRQGPKARRVLAVPSRLSRSERPPCRS